MRFISCAIPAFCSLVIFVSAAHAGPLEDLKTVYEEADHAYSKEDFPKAIELFTQATKMAPKFAPAYVGLGLALKSNGADIDEVLYYYKTASEIDPSNADAAEQLGRLYYALNKFDKAESNFLKALSIDPKRAGVKLSLGWLYLTAKPEPVKAIRYFRDVLAVDHSGNTYFGLGMAYFSNNDREKAMDMITQLRALKEEELAIKLETAMRENRKVSLEPLPEETSAPEPDNGNADNLVDNPDPEGPAAVPAASPAPQAQPTGVKVRLREKLSVLDD